MPHITNDLTFQLLSALGEGVYGVDMNGNCTFINPAALAMLGYEQDAVIGKDQHILFHHHKPNGEHYPHQDCPIYRTLQTGLRHHVTETFIHKDGHLIPIRLTVTPITRHNTIEGAVVAFSDISELLEAQRAIQAERDLFAEGPVSVIIWEIKENWPIHYVSENIENLFGYSRQTMLDSRFRYTNCVHPDDLNAVAEEVEQFIAEKRHRWEQHYRIVHPNGDIRYLHDHTIAEHDDMGSIIRLHGYLIDETQQKRLEHALTEIATIDALTGLPNRRHLLIELETECARFRRMGNAISVLMLDLDHFKLINDTWGHAAGDAVLQHFAHSLKMLARKTDHIGRLGGEEFVIVLPETDEQGAITFAEKVRTTVFASEVTFDKTMINYTVSIGVATCHDRKAENADTILQRADQALYKAKTTGRNRIASINICDTFHEKPTS
jgi:diguanylate cyclase (GGDEF)-like protein/PAS domain S-box-containing protein